MQRDWVKAIVAGLGMVAIFQLGRFFPGQQPSRIFIRILIDAAAFAPLLIVVKLWLPRNRRIQTGWTFFVVTVIVLPVVTILWLFPFIQRHPSLDDAFGRLVAWSGDWFPAIMVAPFALFSILRAYYKDRNRNRTQG